MIKCRHSYGATIEFMAVYHVNNVPASIEERRGIVVAVPTLNVMSSFLHLAFSLFLF